LQEQNNLIFVVITIAIIVFIRSFRLAERLTVEDLGALQHGQRVISLIIAQGRKKTWESCLNRFDEVNKI
jgi:hypothetical protein